MKWINEWIDFKHEAPRNNELVLCLRIDNNKRKYLLGEFIPGKYGNRDYYFKEYPYGKIIDIESNPIDYWVGVAPGIKHEMD